MELILAAAFAGVLGTPHCAAMCGGFAGACAGLAGSGARSSAGLWGWHAGRLMTYGGLGAVAATFGRVLPGPAWLPALLSATLLLWFAASLIGVAPQTPTRVPGLATAARKLIGRRGIGARVVFGMLNGLLPCGMVYAALALAIAAGGPLNGAAVMLAFGAATVPGLTLLAAGVRRLALRSRRARIAVACAIVILGIGSVAMRGFAAAHADSHAAHDVTTSHQRGH